MKIIEKIEIEKFRSFWLWKNKISIETFDLNIFSWKNNSWKSNVLKALNLFFNSETWFNEKYSFDKDYNKAFTTSYGWIIRDIKIKIFFTETWKWILKNWFYIEKIFNKNEIKSNFYYKENSSVKYKKAITWQQTKQFNTYINKINYIYIPAIRDKSFIKHIFKYLQLVLDTNSKDKKSYENSFSEITKILDNRTKKLWKIFEDFIWIWTNVSAPTKILDILEGISLSTDPGIVIYRNIKWKKVKVKVKVSATSSWDWITMSYLPHFLDFLSENIKTKKFIWWFEEPENSLEYAKIQDLSKKFLLDFTENNQIFLTTHNPAFIQLRENKNVSFYRVYKEDWTDEKFSKTETEEELKEQLSLLEEQKDSKAIKKLNEEINFIEFSNDIEKIIEERQNIFLSEKKELQKKQKEVEKKVKEMELLKPEKIFICEDENWPKIWESFFKEYKITWIKIYSSKWCSNFEEEIAIKKIIEKDKTYNPKVFRQNDRDWFNNEQATVLKAIFEKKYKNINYNFSLLSVCEIENFIILDNDLMKLKEDDIDDICDDTRKTIVSNLESMQKYVKWKIEEKLFKLKPETDNLMIRESKKRKNYFLKGKKICNKLKISDKQALIKLENLKFKSFPQELKDYLEEIKQFFEN